MGRNKIHKSYLNLTQAVNTFDSLKTIVECIDFAIKELGELSITNILDVQKFFEYLETERHYELKEDLEFKERFIHPQKSVTRDVNNDRKYKLETVKLNEFSREHNLSIDEATIHIGMNADEYTRSLNALALTVGSNIFFRNGAYKPETEEGRSLLAHELTHIAQNKNKDEYRNASREELEEEAENEEAKEKYDSDPEVLYDTGLRKLKMKNSEAMRIQKIAEQNLEEWMNWMGFSLNDDEYLDLLCKYQKYMEKV